MRITSMATATAPRKKTTKKERDQERAALTAKRENEAKQLVPKIKDEHKAVGEALETGLKHAIRCGEYLDKARKLIRRGKWEAWVETNCKFSIRTARNYLTVFGRQKELPKRDETSYRRAVHMLRRDPTKPIGKKRPARGERKLTISKKALEDAIKTYYKEADEEDLVELLKAIGVVVK
jgi:hypothetical protein